MLLCLTVALGCFLLYHVTQLNRELLIIANLDVPIANSISDLNEYGLRRRLAFERWAGALLAGTPDPAVINEEKTNYYDYTKRITNEIVAAQALLAKAGEDHQHRDSFSEINATLEQLAITYPTVSRRQQEVLALLEHGERERAVIVHSLLNDLQLSVQQERARIDDDISALAHTSAIRAAGRQNRIFWLTIGATVSFVLFGLIFAAAVTQQLVRPVVSLVDGMKTVQGGNLDVQLPIQSGDEIGDLTRSFNFFVNELRSKAEIKRTFGKYIDPRVVEHVLLNPGSMEATGGRRVMTVSFCDLAGFTGLNELLTPTAMVNLLNRHFSLQAEAIQGEHGVIDKFIGDAVMAFWGPPFVGESEHALLACRSALAQKRQLEKFRTELPEITGLRRNAPKIEMRIGIGAGDVVVGNIGSEHARSYTVIGDTVNLASRLESACKSYEVSILISDTARQAANGAIVAREIGFLVVKGKSEPVRVHELLGLAGETMAPGTDKIIFAFEAGLDAYRSQDWEAASRRFDECLAIQPGDGPSKVYLKQIEHLRAHPPGSDWKGVWLLG